MTWFLFEGNRPRARSMSPTFGTSAGVDSLDIYSSFEPGNLTMEDGRIFEGYSFGANNIENMKNKGK